MESPNVYRLNTRLEINIYAFQFILKKKIKPFVRDRYYVNVAIF